MKLTIMVLALLLWGFAKGQFISPGIINSSGARGVVNNIHFEFNLGEGFTTTIGGNGFITQGMLQPMISAQGSLPVTGLQFSAKRINKDKVLLNWSTLQEMNNLGFHIERRKENENNFASLQFIKSKGLNGNSDLPLQYAAVDMNNFPGNTYYRLKQTDIDGKFTYSIVYRVNGEASKSIMLKAWPVPSHGDFTVMVEGIEKDILQLFDVSGKLVRQLSITNASQEKITGLGPGIYFIRLAGEKEVVQKVVVQ